MGTGVAARGATAGGHAAADDAREARGLRDVRVDRPETNSIVLPGPDPLNRNRRSIVLDLKSTHGREVGRRLADQCDVLIEGCRPGVMRRLGITEPPHRSRLWELSGRSSLGLSLA